MHIRALLCSRGENRRKSTYESREGVITSGLAGNKVVFYIRWTWSSAESRRSHDSAALGIYTTTDISGGKYIHITVTRRNQVALWVPKRKCEGDREEW